MNISFLNNHYVYVSEFYSCLRSDSKQKLHTCKEPFASVFVKLFSQTDDG